jgi:hypothetical protein
MPITRTLCACCCARSGAIGAGSLGPSVVSSRYNPVHCPAYHDSGLRSVGLAGRNPGGRNTPPSIAFHYLEEVSSCFEGLPARGASCGVVRMWNEWSTRSTGSGIVQTRTEWSTKSTNSGIVQTRNEWSRKSTNSGIERRTTRCGGSVVRADTINHAMRTHLPSTPPDVTETAADKSGGVIVVVGASCLAIVADTRVKGSPRLDSLLGGQTRDSKNWSRVVGNRNGAG